MSATEELTVDAAVFPEKTKNEATAEQSTSGQEPEEKQTANKATEEEVNNTETPTKSPLIKRRTIFNPFGKAAKKDEPEVVEPISSSEAPAKKTSKGFGTFFSRKSSPKTEEPTDDPEATTADAPTELPQIEQLEPIETDIQVDGQENTDKEATADETTENQEVSEPTNEAEQTASSSNPNTAKRQSFISKLFGKKKQDSTKEEEPVNSEDITTEEEAPKETETPNEEENNEEVAPVASTSRPSSPLGRLTELFISKKTPKKATKPTTEEDKQDNTPAEDEQVEVAVQETSVSTPAPVDASA